MTTRQSTDRQPLDRPADRWSSWQAMDSGRLLLLAVSGMLVVASFASLAVTTDGLPVMPNGRPAATCGSAPMVMPMAATATTWSARCWDGWPLSPSSRA